MTDTMLRMPLRPQMAIASPIYDPSRYPCSPSRSNTTILTLPIEIRQQIYRYLWSPEVTITITSLTQMDPSNPTMAYIEKTTSSSTINTSILYSCKQIHCEILPMLYSHIHLHITFDLQSHCGPPMQAFQPNLPNHIPASVLKCIPRVTYHFPLLNNSDTTHHRPARQPFKFSLMPGLKRFSLRKSFKVTIEMLHAAEALGTGQGTLTRSLYERFSDERKVEVWTGTGLLDVMNLLGTVARFGGGGWVSALVVPETYKYGNWTGEIQDACGDVTGLGVPPGCDIVVEVHVLLYAGQSSRPLVMGHGFRPVIVGQNLRPVHIETITLEVGVKEKKIRNVAFIKPDT